FVVFLGLGDRLANLLGLWRYTRPFGNLATDFRRLFTVSGTTGALVVLSTLVHILTIWGLMLLAWGINVDVGFMDCLVIVPAVILVTTIPISIAGWGLREGA